MIRRPGREPGPLKEYQADLPDLPAFTEGWALGEPDHILGEGTWYIPIRGNLMTMPAENITWDGNAYRFDMQLRLGPMGGDFVVAGTVADDGAIQGEFEGDGMVPFSAFEGMLAGDN